MNRFRPGSTLGNNLLDRRGLSRRLSPPVSSLHWWRLRTPSLRRKQTCSSILHFLTPLDPSTLRFPALPKLSPLPNGNGSLLTLSPAPYPSLNSPSSTR